MALLPTFRRFTQADVPTAPNWVNAIFNPLNVFCEQTVQAFKQGLTIGENVQGMKFTTTYTPLVTYPATADFVPITFAYTGGGRPDCCLVGQAVRADGIIQAEPLQVVNWYLNLNTNPYTVVIKYISGLQYPTKYTITFLVI